MGDRALRVGAGAVHDGKRCRAEVLDDILRSRSPCCRGRGDDGLRLVLVVRNGPLERARTWPPGSCQSSTWYWAAGRPSTASLIECASSRRVDPLATIALQHDLSGVTAVVGTAGAIGLDHRAADGSPRHRTARLRTGRPLWAHGCGTPVRRAAAATRAGCRARRPHAEVAPAVEGLAGPQPPDDLERLLHQLELGLAVGKSQTKQLRSTTRPSRRRGRRVLGTGPPASRTPGRPVRDGTA